MTLQDTKAALATLKVPVYVGYPATGATMPYVVIRPLIADPTNEALAGNAIDWDNQISAYCAASGVEASVNLGFGVMRILQGRRVAGQVLSTSMGYSGAPVEGHFETQVTIQSNQGEI